MVDYAIFLQNKMHNPRDAEKYLETAVSLHNNGVTNLQMGKFLSREHRYNDAIEYFSKVLRLNKERNNIYNHCNCVCYYEYGFALYKIKNYIESQKMYVEAFRIDKQINNGASRFAPKGTFKIYKQLEKKLNDPNFNNENHHNNNNSNNHNHNNNNRNIHHNGMNNRGVNKQNRNKNNNSNKNKKNHNDNHNHNEKKNVNHWHTQNNNNHNHNHNDIFENMHVLDTFNNNSNNNNNNVNININSNTQFSNYSNNNNYDKNLYSDVIGTTTERSNENKNDQNKCNNIHNINNNVNNNNNDLLFNGCVGSISMNNEDIFDINFEQFLGRNINDVGCGWGGNNSDDHSNHSHNSRNSHKSDDHESGLLNVSNITSSKDTSMNITDNEMKNEVNLNLNLNLNNGIINDEINNVLEKTSERKSRSKSRSDETDEINETIERRNKTVKRTNISKNQSQNDKMEENRIDKIGRCSTSDSGCISGCSSGSDGSSGCNSGSNDSGAGSGRSGRSGRSGTSGSNDSGERKKSGEDRSEEEEEEVGKKYKDRELNMELKIDDNNNNSKLDVLSQEFLTFWANLPYFEPRKSEYYSKFVENEWNCIAMLKLFTNDILINEIGMNSIHAKLFENNVSRMNEENEKFLEWLRSFEFSNEYCATFEKLGVYSFASFYRRFKNVENLINALTLPSNTDIIVDDCHEMWQNTPQYKRLQQIKKKRNGM